MKVSQKDPEKVVWEKSPSGTHFFSGSGRPVPKLIASLILLVSTIYIVYTVKFLAASAGTSCKDSPFSSALHRSLLLVQHPNKTDAPNPARNRTAVTASSPADIRSHQPAKRPTEIHDIVFGIAASSKLWQHRKEYIKTWYRPKNMRGVVWLDDRVKSTGDDKQKLPHLKISTDTSNYPYTNPVGHRSAIRISRIVTETLRLKHRRVRWFVMGDDDTVFITENLLQVLRKYDHNQFYYIGSLSESHIQNIFFSYGMAYGGGGFAISYPLAKALSKMQDRCIQRYPGLYGSDDRMQACMAELGVPLTKELGFHQYDVYGNLFGLLAAHPVTPLVSLHHLDVVEPIFPNSTRVDSINKLMIPAKLDSAALMQQSICYDKSRSWTVSISWGFAVQLFRGEFSAREMEMPSRTFLNWYRRADYTAYAFNTRPVSRTPCQKPFVFYMSRVRMDPTLNTTVSRYVRHDQVPSPLCRWRMADPGMIHTVVVYKKPEPQMWNRSPRRNCCRVIDSDKEGTMVVDVGMCKDGELSEL